MNGLLALTLVLAATADASDRVLIMDLEAVSVAPEDADAATRLVAAAAADVDGVVVMSSADLRRLASLEADRFKAGCDEDASCMAELAGALGAERVLYGSLSRLGTTTTVVLSLYDAQTTKVTRRSFDVADMGAMPSQLRASTTELLGGEVQAVAPVASGPILGVATLGTGLGLALVGGATALVAEYVFVQDPNGNGAAKPTWQTVGVAGAIGAGVGLTVAVVGGALMAGGL